MQLLKVLVQIKFDRYFLQLLFRDSFIAGSGVAIGRLFLLLLSLFISRELDNQAQFGIFSTAIIFSSIASGIGGFGLAQTAARSIALEDKNPSFQKQAIRTILLLLLVSSILVGLLIFFLASFISNALEGKVPEDIIRVAAFVTAAQVVLDGVFGILRGLGRFVWIPLSAIIASIFSIFVAKFLLSSLDVIAGLQLLLLYLSVSIIISMIPFTRWIPGPFPSLMYFKNLLGSVASPIFLSGLGFLLAMMVPPLMLVRSKFGLEHVAIWNAASQLRALISFAPVVIANTSIPHFAKLFGQNRLTRKQVASSLSTIIFAAFLPYLPVVFFANTLMSFYGKSYYQHGNLLILVSSFVLLQVIGTGLSGVLITIGRVWQQSILNCLWSIVTLAIAPIAIRYNGAYALGLLHLVIYFPVLSTLLYLVMRKKDFNVSSTDAISIQ